MDINFQYLKTEELANLHTRAENELKTALLQGADWEKISEKRRIVVELSIALHKRKSPGSYGGSPAENPGRRS